MDPTADSDDMHASNFWTANGWQALRAVPWEEFVSAYESYVEQVETLLVDEVQRLHHHPRWGVLDQRVLPDRPHGHQEA